MDFNKQIILDHVTQIKTQTSEFLIKHDAIITKSWNTMGVIGLLSTMTYFLPSTYHKLFHRVQNLKKKYGAEWALVSGGSSGIGKAIVERLASQGINVVIAAYPDKLFKPTMDELTKKFPNIQFIGVEVDLSKTPTCLTPIIDATKNIDIQIVFNNAGYIKTGFFTDVPIEQQLANHNTNATAAMLITHHFVSLMLQKKKRGCVGFTSSPAGFMPAPFSSLYSSTKAYLTMFAMSIAPELKSDGIDVCVVHPSPVASNFYQGTHAIGILKFFEGTATGPQRISDAIFATMGRSVVRDQGYYPPIAKLLMKIIDINFFADIVTATASWLPDFSKLKGVKMPSTR
jgi:short-subunit dehydrogenase